MLATSFLRFKDDTRGLPIYELMIMLGGRIKFVVVAPSDIKTKNREIIDGIEIHRFTYMLPRGLQKLTYGDGIPTNLRKSFLARAELPLFLFFFFLKTLFVAKDCDLIHAQRILSGLIGLLVKKIRKKPVLLTVRRAVNTGFLMKRVNKFVLENVDYVFFNSSYTKNKFLSFTKPRAYSVVRPTVDCHKFRPGLKTNLKEKYKIKKGDFVLLTIGQLVEKKGFKYLVQALPLVLKKHNNVKLIIGGYGIEENNLRALAKDLDVGNNVIFAGEIKSNLTSYYYNIADIFILPSIMDSKGETETLGVVLLEAMACGCAVIGSNVGGIPDVITKSVGFLVEQKNPKQIAEKINFLLDNKHIMKRMGANAIKRVKDNFTRDKAKGNILEAYNYVLKNG